MGKKRPIEEVWKDVVETKRYDVKRLRRLHKELKQYGRGEGIPFLDRYPLFECYLALVASLAVVIVIVLIIFVS